MAEQLERNTKTYILGLLTSCPLVLNIRKLSVDYKNTIGDEIPYHRLGYNSLEHFLKSIPDTVIVNGNGPLAEVLPVTSEKSAHINKLVTNQKVTFNKMAIKHGATKRPTNRYNQNKYPQMEKNNAVSKRQPPEKSVQSVAPHQPVLELEHPTLMKDKVCHHYKNRKPKTDATNKIPNIDVSVKDVTSYSGVSTLLQQELRETISRCPDGIWYTDLPHLYNKIFHKQLDYESQGYTRLIDMCINLPGIFHYVPSSDNFRLYDGNHPLPKNIHQVEEVQANQDCITLLTWDDCKNLVPDSVCKLGSIIPRQFIAESLKANDQLDVVVVEIYDPSKFWIYLADSKLDQLMDDMQKFYRANCQDYAIPEFLLVEGLYCTQIIYGEYHRALIVDRLPNVKGQVKLLYIDYGTLIKAPSEGICFLDKRFSHLPWQQIRCCLTNITPVETLSPWSYETIERFKQLVKNRQIVAKVGAVDVEEKILHLFLADVTDEDAVFYLNDRLVEEGFAQSISQERETSNVELGYKLMVKNLHIFPTFTELEYGLAPSQLEMQLFNKLDVPLNLCLPHYFEPIIDRDDWNIVENMVEFYKTVIVSLSRSDIEHDYDINLINESYFDFDIFHEYGLTEMGEEFKEFIVYDEAGGSVGEEEEVVKGEDDDVVALKEDEEVKSNIMDLNNIIQDNFQITNSLLLDIEKGLKEINLNETPASAKNEFTESPVYDYVTIDDFIANSLKLASTNEPVLDRLSSSSNIENNVNLDVKCDEKITTNPFKKMMLQQIHKAESDCVDDGGASGSQLNNLWNLDTLDGHSIPYTSLCNSESEQPLCDNGSTTSSDQREEMVSVYSKVANWDCSGGDAAPKSISNNNEPLTHFNPFHPLNMMPEAHNPYEAPFIPPPERLYPPLGYRMPVGPTCFMRSTFYVVPSEPILYPPTLQNPPTLPAWSTNDGTSSSSSQLPDFYEIYNRRFTKKH